MSIPRLVLFQGMATSSNGATVRAIIDVRKAGAADIEVKSVVDHPDLPHCDEPVLHVGDHRVARNSREIVEYLNALVTPHQELVGASP